MIDPVQAQVRAPKRIAVHSELVRVAHWVEGGQYFRIADRVVPSLCKIILGRFVMAWDKMAVQEE